MKKTLFSIFIISSLIGCKDEAKEETAKTYIPLNYPETKQVDTVDTYFGTEVKDPYR